MGQNEKIFTKYYIIITITLIFILILFIPLILIFNNKEFLNTDNQQYFSKTLTSIRIIRVPKKTTYREGEIFNKEGMLVKACYNDNTESYITDYETDKNSPLTVYDSKVTIIYKEKTTYFTIKIYNNDRFEVLPNPSRKKHTVEIIEGIVTRFEIENADFSNWIISNENNKNRIIKRSDASGRIFLSGIDEKNYNEGRLIFDIDLKFNAEISMSISYSQTEKWKNNDTLIPSIYSIFINEYKSVETYGTRILRSRQNITQWQTINYDRYILPKGKHTLSIKASINSELGYPSIDYIDFNSNRVKEVPIEHEFEDMPSNDFHTLLQYKYLTDEDLENVLNYAHGSSDLSRPKGIFFDINDMIKEYSYYYYFQFSSSKKFDSSDTRILDLRVKKFYLKNLKIGQKLFYRVALNKNKLSNSKIYELEINSLPPRNLDIPGVDNSRDIGGRKTNLIKNGIINQGLYYRTARIEYITEEGKKVLKEDLGVKVEIDLRDENVNLGPYVDGIEYFRISIPSSSNGTQRFENFEEEYIKVFDLIANADNKPIVLHCTAGADRTGIMTFALLNLLGCDYKDIVRDYLFTNFGVQGSRNLNSEFNEWWEKLDLFDGETKTEKCKSWLMSKGIKEEILEHIREIFIDGYKGNLTLNNNENEQLKGETTVNDLEFLKFYLDNDIISLNKK